MNGVLQLKIYSQKQIINDYILLVAGKDIYLYKIRYIYIYTYIYISIYLKIVWKLAFLKIISTIT